ncbi:MULTISPECIES: hypothetical protein [unclassified Vibrio]|uniref:hypothetical protein n=1 Tax=unclassified Vibrio TaxID=2614977 RepID=UPI00148369BD|nr:MULTISPECIES: hypothetical protein [unclassified Vibrio]MDQ2192868.1 hypothetical protein [Vibrio sp. A14(2019)]MDQ2197963.1 hypothetical protein [Vibrio sp. 2017_1457_11]NNN75958.1 hypothetical protein [Vibrio sp. B7]NNN93862.1 hypothetical protein [Vibrio sp. B8-1]NNO08224.1 hypothetical protein [Vibrio sp. B4-12]
MELKNSYLLHELLHEKGDESYRSYVQKLNQNESFSNGSVDSTPPKEITIAKTIFDLMAKSFDLSGTQLSAMKKEEPRLTIELQNDSNHTWLLNRAGLRQVKNDHTPSGPGWGTLQATPLIEPGEKGTYVVDWVPSDFMVEVPPNQELKSYSLDFILLPNDRITTPYHSLRIVTMHLLFSVEWDRKTNSGRVGLSKVISNINNAGLLYSTEKIDFMEYYNIPGTITYEWIFKDNAFLISLNTEAEGLKYECHMFTEVRKMQGVDYNNNEYKSMLKVHLL